MPRVTDAEVRAVKPSEISDYSPFIMTASISVDDLESLHPSYSADKLKVIELYLSAHYVAVSSPDTSSESPEQGVNWKYHQGRLEMGLDSTTYGQQANALSGGKLKGILNSTNNFEFVFG